MQLIRRTNMRKGGTPDVSVKAFYDAHARWRGQAAGGSKESKRGDPCHEKACDNANGI